MAQRRPEAREFVLRSVPRHPRDLVAHVAGHFGISRQAAARYVRELVDAGKIKATGERKERVYELAVLEDHAFTLQLSGLEEHVVWETRIGDKLKGLPQNVVAMWNYGCSEMINNAIDHSDGTSVTVRIRRTATNTEVDILDDGIGIFIKIKKECGLQDERQSVLELSKGKLTTDPKHHSGEGIFFTSRIMDQFAILSGEVHFSHEFGKAEDWIVQGDRPDTGTYVAMVLSNDSERTVKEVMEGFAADEENFGFNKTVVPVRMVREGSDGLVSRSQAKRLLTRVDRFATVILDFADVDTIGRAFADDIFRVFVRANPQIVVIPINTNPEVLRMITSVRSGKEPE
jgi:anti-sigma regulatory factor (Ser/Thr protein kinase)